MKVSYWVGLGVAVVVVGVWLSVAPSLGRKKGEEMFGKGPPSVERQEGEETFGKGPPPESTYDREADDAVKAIKSLWPPAQAITRADFALATCGDTTKTYDAMRACLVTTLETTATAVSSLGGATPSVPTSACALQISRAISTYAAAQQGYLLAFANWFKANEQKLRPAMRSKSLIDACRGPVACDGFYEIPTANFSGVMGVSCTESLFTCGPRDNVCSINKVADRLDGSSGPLTVRATGRAVH
jgi:hypothetical protein